MGLNDDAEAWDNGREVIPSLDSQQTRDNEIERLRRETYRSVRAVDRMRISASYRLGRLFTDAIFSPIKLILLPFRTVSLVWRVGLERLGRREPPELTSKLEYTLSEEPSRTIIFFPTNGTGLGHFTRLFSIARRIRRADPSIQVIFFTTCSATHLLQLAGIPAYHLPERKRIPDMSAEQWNLMAEESLSTVLEMHNPSMFVFDGIFPYRGILHAIFPHRDMHKVWIRRGNFRKEINFPIETLNHFDLVVHPKDSVDEVIKYPRKAEIDVLECDPVVFADYSDLHPRQFLKKKLGIPDNAIMVYVQLGAGKINNIKKELGIIMSVLSEYDNIYTIVGQSILGEKVNFEGPRVRIIRDYPNSLYFKSFDFAVVAGGYNTYNEIVKFALPAISFPNMKTGRDDQFARVSVAAEAGGMEVITDVQESKFRESVERLLDVEIRGQMSKSLSTLIRPNGANQIALKIINMLGRGINEIPPAKYGDFDSNIEPYWELVRSSYPSNITHEWDDEVALENNKIDLLNGIFSVNKLNQPKLIFDTTKTFGDLHTVIRSPNLPVDPSRYNESVLSCDVELIVQPISKVNVSSVIVLSYQNSNGKEIAQQKIRTRLVLNKSININEIITPPKAAKTFSVSIIINRLISCKLEYTNFEIKKIDKNKKRNQQYMSKDNSVSMFVFNSFENDTRVYREAKSLIEAGYTVKIYALKKTHLPEREIMDGIDIIRIQLLPFHLKLIRACKKISFFPLFISVLLLPIWVITKSLKIIFTPLNGFIKWITYSMIFKNSIPLRARRRRVTKPTPNKLDMLTRSMCESFVRKIFMPFHRYIQFYFFDKQVLKLVKSEPSKIYHAHDLNTLRVAAKAAKIHRSKLVYDSHELYVNRNRPIPASRLKNLMLRLYEKKLINKTDLAITVNESIAQLLSKRYGVKIPEVVMNTPPKQDIRGPPSKEMNLRDILSVDKKHSLVLYTGAITYNRGLEKLVESIKYIDDVHLVLMGYGNDEYLHELYKIAEESGVLDRYSKFGPVPSEEVSMYASSADLGVAPIQNSCLSYYLCSPNKVFEYIQAGLPVIASNFPELRKVVVDKKIGYVFDPEDSKDIAETIKRVIKDKSKLLEMKENCKSVIAEFNWENESAKLKNAYELMLPIKKESKPIIDILERGNRLLSIE